LIGYVLDLKHEKSFKKAFKISNLNHIFFVIISLNYFMKNVKIKNISKILSWYLLLPKSEQSRGMIVNDI